MARSPSYTRKGPGRFAVVGDSGKGIATRARAMRGVLGCIDDRTYKSSFVSHTWRKLHGNATVRPL